MLVMKQIHKNLPSRAQAGFTILELLVATTVFAVILLVVAVGVIRFTDSYYKGITSSKTQTTTRAVTAEISQSIQFGKNVSFLSSSGVSGICIDNTLYSYKLGQQVTDIAPFAAHQSYHGLIATVGGDCTGGIPAAIITALNAPPTGSLPSGSRELLGQHMRLGALTVAPAGNLYTIRVKVIYGDDDLLYPLVFGGTVWSNEICNGQVAGAQFCAVSDLSTTVEQRLL